MSMTQRRLLIVTGTLVAILALGAWTRDYLGIELDVESVRAFAEGLGTAGPLLFVFVVAGRSLLALPSQIVLIAAGLCFGTLIGSIVGGAGLMLSGLSVFLIARYAGRESVEKRISLRGRRLLEFATHRTGAVTYAVACGYPLMPLTPIQAAAGLTPMPTGYFIPAAFAGGSIRASIFAYFGNALVDADLVSMAYAAGLFALFAAVPLAFPTGRAWIREVFSPIEVKGQGEDAPRDP
jgi:uncharacterized membrane protein YdjX (TVP38/TMEM64 family)